MRPVPAGAAGAGLTGAALPGSAAGEGVVAPDVQDPAPTAPPVDTLPPEERSSEQTVQPESETLFY